VATTKKTEAPRDEQLAEAQAGYREQKARNSDLSRDLDLARREIKTWQDEAAQVDGLKERIGELEAELKEATQLNEQLANAAEKSEVNTGEVQKRADAFIAIREALETK
jgi:hypothetical protein